MAQEVHYMDNNVTYLEGPFVIVNINGWRIEVELKGHHCPILPDNSIYTLSKRYFGLDGKTNNKELITKVCDYLNRLVKEDRIVLKGKMWVDSLPHLPLIQCERSYLHRFMCDNYYKSVNND